MSKPGHTVSLWGPLDTHDVDSAIEEASEWLGRMDAVDRERFRLALFADDPSRLLVHDIKGPADLGLWLGNLRNALTAVEARVAQFTSTGRYLEPARKELEQVEDALYKLDDFLKSQIKGE